MFVKFLRAALNLLLGRVAISVFQFVMASLTFSADGISDDDRQNIEVCYRCEEDKHLDKIDLIPGGK